MAEEWALDNIFVERLWRIVKYEYIYQSRPEAGIAIFDRLTIDENHNL